MDTGVTARKQRNHLPAAVQSTSYAQFHKRSISATTERLPASPPATLSSHTRTKSHASGRPSTEVSFDGGPRHHIGNVGIGGTLYLRPSRLPPQQPLPVTPPDTSYSSRSDWTRQSSAAVERNRARGGLDHKSYAVPVPPLSLANHARRRRGRSFSISTASDAVPDAIEARPMGEVSGRSASALEMRGGLLNTYIPHYRLGTPRWSTRGTAYLHPSAYASSTDERSSIGSHQPYEQFPAPPGTRKGSDNAGMKMYLHPEAAGYALPSLQPTSSIVSSQDGTPSSIFDKIEVNTSDPTNVRFASGSARIVAATVPRLVVQITSVRFLDYELLSDFFLAYRGFLTSSDLLDWLLERMRWAINSLSDTGRIVRVRTFVALRHWILNYYADDFAISFDLRRRFCDSVNRLAYELSKRGYRASGDLNIVGELKKCWRRTSAQFYPASDAMDASPLVDILPGGSPEISEAGLSATDLPQVLRAASAESELPLKGMPLFALDQKTNQKAKIVSIISEGSAVYVHRGSIPASPLSEDSLRILSCSIPFLQKIRPDANAERRAQRSAPRPAMAQRQNSLSRRKPAESKHRRNASFNDALRDTTSPLPSANPDAVTLDQLPNITLTGGLVRGLLLTPPPAAITRYAVRSPPMEPGRHHGSEDYFKEVDLPHNSVRRIVGDVKRALSLRKASSDASSRGHRSGSSNNSRSSNRVLDDVPRSEPSEPSTAPTSTLPTSISRSDLLAARIQQSYRKHFLEGEPGSDEIAVSFPKNENARPTLPRSRSHRRSVSDVARRLGSQISTSPRSIVIIDATAMMGTRPADFMTPGLAPDSLRPSPLFEGLADYPLPQSGSSSGHRSHIVRSSSDGQTSSNYVRDTSIDGRLHQSFLFPEPLSTDNTFLSPTNGMAQYRRSSDVHGSLFNEILPSSTTKQIRRRPGGDLKAADNVQDLVFSTISDGDEFGLATPSAAFSRNFSIPSHGPARGTLQRSASHASSRPRVDAMDRTSSQPHLRPSHQRLASVEERITHKGGIEETLARLEGKAQKSRNSGLSWFELPVEHRGLKAIDLNERKAAGSDGADFEMLDPMIGSHLGRIYRISKNDFSEEVSMDSQQVAHPPLQAEAQAHGGAFRLVDADLDPILAARKADVISAALTVQSSFLLNDNESLDDISTDMEDGPEESLGVRSFFFDEQNDDLGQLATFRSHVTSPTSLAKQQRSFESGQSKDFNLQPPPVTVSNAASKILGLPQGTVVTGHGQLTNPVSKPAQGEVEPPHLPFVLAFEAEVLAEQLCIIEKDALDEVDWKDLIALNWQHSPKQIRNWADYLKLEESNGIDLVIARFNLTVKWVVSQCVLTEAISERARCISKFIHVAVHCLRLRNYASMYQITLALLSSDLARLQRTWTFVPLGDRRMLDRLEILCQPLRNFQALRLEMESASFADGCIPFIGLYTHDLTYNAQKPAKLEAVRTSVINEEGPTLINFERFQTAAVIAKSLLRLLEASAAYVFRPHPEALSRCLWLAALEDREISKICDGLE